MSQVKKEISYYSCSKCSKFISFDALVQHKHKAYHMECFVCSNCNNRLLLTETPILRKGSLFCSKCSKLKRNRFTPLQYLNKSLKRSNRNTSKGYKSGGSKETKYFKEIDVLGDEDKLESVQAITGYKECFPEADSFNIYLIIQRINLIRLKYLENIVAKIIPEGFLTALDDECKETQVRFFKCISSCLNTPYNNIGLLAMNKDDFFDFNEIFRSFIISLNKLNKRAQFHMECESLLTRFKLDFTYNYNILPYKNKITGCQFQFQRNLVDFPMIGSMSLDERNQLEDHLFPVIELLNDKYNGSLICFNYKFEDKKFVEVIELEEYFRKRGNLVEFVKDHNQHKLESKYDATTISKRFPSGSGLYISEDKRFRLYYNHENHLMFEFHSNHPSYNFNQDYRELVEFMNDFEQSYLEVYNQNMEYLVSDEFGFLTTCPTNLGSGFNCSVFLKLAELSEQDGIRNVSKALKVECVESVLRDDYFKVSPQVRIFDTEEMIVKKLHKVIPLILQLEEEADSI